MLHMQQQIAQAQAQAQAQASHHAQLAGRGGQVPPFQALPPGYQNMAVPLYRTQHQGPPPGVLDYQAAAYWREQQRSQSDRGSKKGSPQQNPRKRISPEQALILETSFQETPRPDKEKRENLSEKTGLPVRNIQIWFQNRRAKAKANNETAVLKKMAEYNNTHSNQHMKKLAAPLLTPAAAAGLKAAPSSSSAAALANLASKPLPPLPGEPPFESSLIKTPPMVGNPPLAGTTKTSPSKSLSSKFAHPYLSGIPSSSNGSFKSPSSIVQRVPGSNNIVSQIVQIPPTQGGIVMASPYSITPQTSNSTIGLQSPVSSEAWNIVENDEALLTPMSFQSPSVSPFMSSTMRSSSMGGAHNGSTSSLVGISDSSAALASPASFESMTSHQGSISHGHGMHGGSHSSIISGASSHSGHSNHVMRRRPSNLGVSRRGMVTPVNNNNGANKVNLNADYSWTGNASSKSATEISFAFAGSPNMSPSHSPATPANQQLLPPERHESGGSLNTLASGSSQLRRSLSTSGIIQKSPYRVEKGTGSPYRSGSRSPAPISKAMNEALSFPLDHDGPVGSGEHPHRVSVVAEEDEIGLYDDLKNDPNLSFYFGSDFATDLMNLESLEDVNNGVDSSCTLQDLSGMDILGMTN